MSLTLAEARVIVAKGLQTCGDDPRVDRYVNEGTERLLANGKWKGTLARYNIQTCGGVLTLPYELETCIRAARCGMPMRVRNQWFEFIESGPGPQGARNASSFNLHDRGDDYVTITDITRPSTLRIYADLLEADSASITIMGYDANWNPIRTQVEGAWQDGETILIKPTSPATFQTSAHQWTSITQIVKSKTNGTIRLYSVDEAGNQTLLGLYGPNTTNPTFRRYELAELRSSSLTTLFTICKRRYIKVSEPNDVLIIQSEAALKDIAKAISLSEAGDETGSEALEAKAVKHLNGLLEEHMGDAGVMDVQVRPFAPSAVRAFY